MARIPAAEVDVTLDLVRGLLESQHPDLLEGRDLQPFSFGWDNVMLRLGGDLLVRVPRRALAAELIEHEQAWLPELRSRLPVAVPAPVRTGVPAAGYPWHWSVVPWVDGDVLGVPTASRSPVAEDLGRFLAALHVPAPSGVVPNPFRGGDLRGRADLVAERAERIVGAGADTLMARWEKDLEVGATGPRLWVHGDLHPLNVLVREHRLIAVIDWGDITAGDPACDLAIAWLGFSTADAATLRTTYDAAVGHSLDLDALWRRGRAWALHLTLVLLDSSDDHPRLAAVGRHGLARLTARS